MPDRVVVVPACVFTKEPAPEIVLARAAAFATSKVAPVAMLTLEALAKAPAPLSFILPPEIVVAPP